ncbi:MAG: hypothetical protein ACRCW2_00190 [Cellulosilyticaceae bacterium]
MKSQGTKKRYQSVVWIAIGAVVCILVGLFADRYADRVMRKSCEAVSHIQLIRVEPGKDPEVQVAFSIEEKKEQIEQIIERINSEDFYFIGEPKYTGDRMEIGIYTADTSVYIYDVDHSVRILKGEKVISLKAKDATFFDELEAIIRE